MGKISEIPLSFFFTFSKKKNFITFISSLNLSSKMPETQAVQRKTLLDGLKSVFLVPVLTIFVISKGLLSTIKGMTGELFLF